MRLAALILLATLIPGVIGRPVAEGFAVERARTSPDRLILALPDRPAPPVHPALGSLDLGEARDLHVLAIESEESDRDVLCPDSPVSLGWIHVPGPYWTVRAANPPVHRRASRDCPLRC